VEKKIVERYMPIACWIHKATNTHSEYLIFIAFPQQKNGCKNTPQRYIILTLAVFLLCENEKGIYEIFN